MRPIGVCNGQDLFGVTIKSHDHALSIIRLKGIHSMVLLVRLRTLKVSLKVTTDSDTVRWA